MARLFDNASNEYLQISSAPFTAAPYSVSLWVFPDALVAFQVMLGLVDESVADQKFQFFLVGTDFARVQTKSGVTSGTAETGNKAVVDTWSHYFVSEPASDSRTIILDGDTGNKGTDTTDVAPTGVDGLSIGMLRDTTPDGPFSGRIAEVAIWDAGLTDAEGVLLSKAYSPLLVRPANLIFYAPLIRDEDRDIVGGLSLTAFNTPSVDVHTRMLYPAPSLAAPITAATVVGGATKRLLLGVGL